MRRQLKALDLFCGGGGTAAGLIAAGFEVHGIDRRPHPHYPGWFRMGDALDADVSGYDFIWASPPCQKFSRATRMAGWATVNKHPDLLDRTRQLLAGSGAMTCIENVPLAPLRPDIELTGDMFGLRVIRHRIFETNFPGCAPGPVNHGRGLAKAGLVETVAGGGNGPNVVRRWSEAMGITHRMTRRELAQAIPPAYAEWIGRLAIAALDVQSAGRALGPMSAGVGLAKSTQAELGQADARSGAHMAMSSIGVHQANTPPAHGGMAA